MQCTLTELAKLVEGKVCGDGQTVIDGAAPFESAGSTQITFAALPKYLEQIETVEAAAVIVPREFTSSQHNLLQVSNPQVAFAQVLSHFHPRRDPGTGIHAQAVIAADARLGAEAWVGPFVTIESGVVCGRRVKIHPHSHIGQDVVIGDDVEIMPNVTILAGCVLGDRIIIQAGSVIGSDGFGFAPDGTRYHKIPHTGIVQIDDDVEIGANNTIDRATFGKTWIQQGVKTDNLVHIAHNVTIGAHTVLVAQVGISGSTTIGRQAILAGQVGVSGHLKIGDKVTIGPQAGIAQSIADGETVSGSPELPHRLWLRVQRIIPRLPDMRKRLTQLEKRLAAMEQNIAAPGDRSPRGED